MWDSYVYRDLFHKNYRQALAMLADLASTEKGANLVSESGALPICVRLLQSSEVWKLPPEKPKRKGMAPYKKGAFQKERIGQIFQASFFQAFPGSFGVSNGERQERQSQTPSEGG